MLLPTLFLFLVPFSQGLEQDSCYPIVRPLLGLLENCQAMQNKLSEVQKQYYEVTLQFEKQKAQLEQQVIQLQYQNSDLKKSCELGELKNLFSEELEKLQKITQSGQEVIFGIGNNDSKVNSVTKIGATNTTTSPSNSESTIRVLPDRCPSKQDDLYSYPEIQIPGLEPFEVACYSDEYVGAGWIKVYNKFNDLENFNRTYDEYINGFGDPKGPWFIGLKKLHILTNWKPHEVYIDHTRFGERCETFVVGDKSEGYMLKKLDGCTGDTEKFDLIQGTKFSTYDRDEDRNPNKNWAKELGFGWWWQRSGSKYIKKNDYLQISIRRKD
ncbi:angiopoietin-related protein 4-like isoform X3 [Drosophila bipectinata]|uniref:angiopoietin-related protein 4-like isoform X3 n=1 Tax=Drosophila bipectinata TaxID=42026 RepID=UPI0038B25B43